MTILHRATIEQPQPLLAYLLAALPMKRKNIKELLRYHAVSINDRPISQFDHPLVCGDTLTVCDLKTAQARGRLEHARIRPVYEDQALIVVDKPPGLLTVATDREKQDTLFVRLNEYLYSRDAERATPALVVHRLDQETSGLVLFARSEPLKRQLQDSWGLVEKTYWAIVEGEPPAPAGTVENYLVESGKSLKVYSSSRETPDARWAVTHYQTLAVGEDLSLVEVRLQTGRKHQIRVHLADLGCPVVGDVRYGATRDDLHRLALHAARLALAHPTTGQQISFISPLPRAFGAMFPGVRVQSPNSSA